MFPRSNQDWLWALNESPGEAQTEALDELHDFLLRAVLVYLSQNRHELAEWGRQAVRGLAEDLAQEALLEVRDNLHTFRGESKFTTWACRVVINRAASELRRRRYSDLSLDSLRENEPAVFQSLVADKERAEPEHLAERRNYLALLREIVETELGERQRLAVIAVHWQGRSMDEVAEALGLSRNALYKLLHDARKNIRDQLIARHLTPGDILAAFEE
ncbi:MAG: sigma-70 family RNA polymerase sigma factor [Chloroflexi bacterium]|nr:sigma-70 family RNA polymerase sigma factor [Chloroflexota bacterium]